MEVRAINDRVMTVKLIIGGLTVNIISTYMLQGAWMRGQEALQGVNIWMRW